MRVRGWYIPEIFLGIFLTVAVFATGLVVGSSPKPLPISNSQSGEETKDKKPEISESQNPLVRFWNWTTSDATTFYTGVIVIFTGVLAGVGYIQIRQTRILQRAYLSVSPLGIVPFTSGRERLSCDVGFKNVGNLPATNVHWCIDRFFSQNRLFRPPEIDDASFQGGNVISPGTEMIKGGTAIDIASFVTAKQSPGENWLYVWGEVRYRDGFGKNRRTKFCFRYNMAGVSPNPRELGISEHNARYHIYGNDAD